MPLSGEDREGGSWFCLGLAVSGVVRECPAGTADTDLRLSRERDKGPKERVSGGHPPSQAEEKNLTSRRAQNWSHWKWQDHNGAISPKSLVKNISKRSIIPSINDNVKTRGYWE